MLCLISFGGINRFPFVSKGESEYLSTQKVGHKILDLNQRRSVVISQDLNAVTAKDEEPPTEMDIDDRQGQWLRRRRLDGSLNRVPLGFYPLLWELLNRCRGIHIKGNLLPGTLTREMTKGEFKFALQLEMVLNQIPQPEYRQLMVEALMVLSMIVENDSNHIDMSQMDIEVDKIVHEANRLFIEDMKMSQEMVEYTMGAAGICVFLYDSAPSGRFGSMAFMCRALTSILKLPISGDNSIECSVS